MPAPPCPPRLEPSSEDREDEYTEAINAAHPTITKRHDLYAQALAKEDIVCTILDGTVNRAFYIRALVLMECLDVFGKRQDYLWQIAFEEFTSPFPKEKPCTNQ